MTDEKSQSSNRKWLSITTGLLVGVASLFSAQLLDAAQTGGIPDLLAFVGHYVLAAATSAMAFSSVVRALLPKHSDHLGIDWSVVHSSTLAFVLFLVPALVAAPDSTGRWLAYLYAFLILIGWLAWQLPLLPRQPAAPKGPGLIDWDNLPYAPFVMAALLLLTVSAVCSVADQRSAAIQSANWAFGFLWLAVLTAGSCLVVGGSVLPAELRRLARFTLPVAAFVFFPIAIFVDANSASAAEKRVITDVYPNFLGQQTRPGDLMISDSPALRLSSIPQIGPSLLVDPDQRGQALWDDLTRTLSNQRRALWISVPEQSHDTQGTLATFLEANGCLDQVVDSPLPVRVYELNQPFARPSVLPPFWAARTADAFDPVTVNFGPILMTGVRHERRACSHDSVAVAVRWQLPAKVASPLKLSLFLSDSDGRRIQTQDFYIDDPSQRHTDQWQPSVSLPAYYLLTIPLGTPPGAYSLGAAVYPVSQPQWLPIRSAEGIPSHADHVTLGTVQVYRAQDVTADPWKSRQESGMLPANTPVADGLALDGYRVGNPSVIPGESLELALRWRATKDGLASYTTQVSLRQADKIIAQVSGIPVDGTYPTDQYKSGEYVTERRELRVAADATGGPAQLEVAVTGGNPTYLADIAIESIARTFQVPADAHVARATFSGVGELVAYYLANTSPAADQPFQVALYWHAVTPVQRDYIVFAQLLAADGHLIAQSDSQPALGRRPMLSWLPGEIISDVHSLDFKDPNYRGEAKLIVGLYNPETGERVPIEGETHSYFQLPTSVQVVPK